MNKLFHRFMISMVDAYLRSDIYRWITGVQEARMMIIFDQEPSLDYPVSAQTQWWYRVLKERK
ncbi:hypothetical protein UFOVP13_32 [uncultured Caudovirales phage]|uniref:Uncharacterized protein n=1 Tax=uncultured Caudovirales phage TaxID=2100421 RepID=A0A6J5KM33_9CAUD|nr:hypothetical protein UFOVP13_32 [uncultured Caudovirales phage]